jgi:hypothetical protein
VTDPVGLSLGTTDPNPRWPQDFERYFQETARLGFNTVSPELLWSQFESLGADGQPVWDFSLLARIKSLAEVHGLKAIVQWIGSNWAGVTNAVPRYIAENADDTYQKVLRPDGSVAEDPQLPGGVYAWTWENIARKEATALARLAEWLRDNDPQQTIIMVAINIEFGIHPNLGADRSYDERSNHLYTQGAYTEPRRFNQDTAQAYFQTLTAAFHQVLPDFPLATAAWPDNHGNPYNYLLEWLDRVPDLSLIGPDLYGARLDEVDHYRVGRNAVYVLNQGVNQYAGLGSGYVYCDWPWRIVFPLAGEPYNALGIGLYRLVGPQPLGPTSPLFWGLLSNGAVGSPPAWSWFPWAYYARDSFVGLRGIASRIPEFQGTPRLAAFPTADFPAGTGTLDLDGLTVRIEAPTPVDCDADFATYRPGSRGLLIRTGERDLTLVGVDYTATIEADTKGWNLRAERGFWDGDTWRKTGDALPGSVTADPDTGHLSVALSPDDLESLDAAGLQYIVRVYDAGPGGAKATTSVQPTLEEEGMEGEILPTWVEVWGGPGQDGLWDAATDGNSLYVVGKDQARLDSDVIIRKYDLNANLLWDKIWDLGSADTAFVAIVSGDALYVGGKAGDLGGGEDALILKYTLDGALVWERTWGTTDYEEVDGLALQGDVLYAYIWTGPISGDMDIGILRYTLDGDLLGNSVWEFGAQRNEANGHLYADASGLYGAGGVYTSATLFSESDVFLARFDLNGEYLGHSSWGGAKGDNALNLVSDGEHLYLAGMTSSYGEGGWDAFVLQYAKDGELVWSRTWGGPNDEVARGIAVDSDYVWVTVKTKSYGRGGWDLALLKYTKDGTFLGYKLWGGAGDDEPHSLILHSGFLYILGDTASFGTDGKDAFLMKVEK